MIIATTAGHRVVTTPGQVFGAERFIDPDSGKAVDVFYNPASGERQYVAQEPEKKN